MRPLQEIQAWQQILDVPQIEWGSAVHRKGGDARRNQVHWRILATMSAEVGGLQRMLFVEFELGMMRVNGSRRLRCTCDGVLRLQAMVGCDLMLKMNEWRKK